MVSMAVTSVMMAVVTAGMIMMYRAGNRTDVLSVNVTQLEIAFQQLDRSVRYATAISQPDDAATADGDWYVEWSATSSDGTMLCSQLRLQGSTGLLQRRSQAAGSEVGGWATVASFIDPARPFTLQPADTSGYPHQRLTVDVTVQSAPGSAEPRRRATFSFTALNTSLTTSSSGVCIGMARS